MKCPRCGFRKSEVLNTISFQTFKQRIRRCLKCYHEWKTKETYITHDEYVDNMKRSYGIQEKINTDKR